MEWLAQALETILTSQIWKYIATHFYWVDWLTLGFAFGGVMYGIRKGFLRTLIKLLEVFLIAYLTFLYASSMSAQIHIYFPVLASRVLPATGFIAVALLAGIVVLLIDSKLSQWFHASIPGPVRIGGGVVTGLFYGLFLWSFISQPLVITPMRALQKNYDKQTSLSGPLIRTLAPAIYQKVRP